MLAQRFHDLGARDRGAPLGIHADGAPRHDRQLDVFLQSLQTPQRLLAARAFAENATLARRAHAHVERRHDLGDRLSLRHVNVMGRQRVIDVKAR